MLVFLVHFLLHRPCCFFVCTIILWRVFRRSSYTLEQYCHQWQYAQCQYTLHSPSLYASSPQWQYHCIHYPPLSSLCKFHCDNTDFRRLRKSSTTVSITHCILCRKPPPQCHALHSPSSQVIHRRKPSTVSNTHCIHTVQCQ